MDILNYCVRKNFMMIQKKGINGQKNVGQMINNEGAKERV